MACSRIHYTEEGAFDCSGWMHRLDVWPLLLSLVWGGSSMSISPTNSTLEDYAQNLAYVCQRFITVTTASSTAQVGRVAAAFHAGAGADQRASGQPGVHACPRAAAAPGPGGVRAGAGVLHHRRHHRWQRALSQPPQPLLPPRPPPPPVFLDEGLGLRARICSGTIVTASHVEVAVPSVSTRTFLRDADPGTASLGGTTTELIRDEDKCCGGLWSLDTTSRCCTGELGSRWRGSGTWCCRSASFP